jgi:hypothetical protein
MTTARAGLGNHGPAVDHRDQFARYHHRASRLFEKDHAYAARLVQTATAISDVVRSTTTIKLPDRVPSEFEGDDRITAEVVRRPGAHGRGS